LLINHGIKGVDNTGSLNNIFESEIELMIGSLESMGATIIGIACNTAHVYIDRFKVKPHTTLINLIDMVAKESPQLPSDYLLLTSSTSKNQKLYHTYLDRYGVKFQETNESQQNMLDEAISLVMAHKLKESGRIIDRVLLSAKQQGFSAVIAGCTELPIAIANSKNKFNLHIIDSNEVLAKALLKKYYDD
jgi:aspartate racemase